MQAANVVSLLLLLLLLLLLRAGRSSIGSAIAAARSGITDRRRPPFLISAHRRLQILKASALPMADLGGTCKENKKDDGGGIEGRKCTSSLLADSDRAPPPETPEKPLDGDCCGSGCVRCVWDVYYEELQAYNEALSRPAASSKDHAM